MFLSLISHKLIIIAAPAVDVHQSTCAVQCRCVISSLIYYQL